MLLHFNNQILRISPLLRFSFSFFIRLSHDIHLVSQFKHLKNNIFHGTMDVYTNSIVGSFWLTRSFFPSRLRNNRRWLHEEKCIVSAIGETCNLHESVQESRGINLPWAGANGVCKVRHISICMTRRYARAHRFFALKRNPLRCFVIWSITRFTRDGHSRSCSECYLIRNQVQTAFHTF